MSALRERFNNWKRGYGYEPNVTRIASDALDLLDEIAQAIEQDECDAKAACGGDGKGCPTFRDYYDSDERRWRKCGQCPMDALHHSRAALAKYRGETRDE